MTKEQKNHQEMDPSDVCLDNMATVLLRRFPWCEVILLMEHGSISAQQII